MMTTPVVKKGFHFASDGIHAALFVEAETIEEATKLYHQLKQRISGVSTPAPVQATAGAPVEATPATAPEAAAPAPVPAPKEDTNG